MYTTINQLPVLLKRKHITTTFGLSDSLYYSLVKESKLPTVKINNRIYVDRDKLLSMINAGTISLERSE